MVDCVGCAKKLNVEIYNFDWGVCKALDGSTASISALCDDLRDKYPNRAPANENAYKLGNFECDQGFNTEECGWDMGDYDVTNYLDYHKILQGEKDHKRAYRTRVLNINRRMYQNQQGRTGRKAMHEV